MALGMCCVVPSMFEPGGDRSFMGSLSHMADHMTPQHACRQWAETQAAQSVINQLITNN